VVFHPGDWVRGRQFLAIKISKFYEINERRHLKKTVAEGRIILKWFLKK
jgi:hypothetical protein